MELPPIAEFQGSHYEMGLQQGQRYQENLKLGLKTLPKTIEFTAMKPRWLPSLLFFSIARKKAYQWFQPQLTKWAPNQAERAKGIAEGAQIDLKWIYLLLGSEIMLGTHDYEIPLSEGCTNIGITQERTQYSEPMVARNFDYARFVLPFLQLRKNRPTGLYQSFDLTAAPLPGTFNGINEKGVFIGTNECFATSEREDGLSASVLIQEALETCANTGEVITYLQKSPRGSTNNWLVADASNDIRALEYTSKRLYERAIEPGSQGGFVVVTNHFEREELRAIDLPLNAVFGKKSPLPLQGIVINETSKVRFMRASELLRHPNRVAVPELQAILRDHTSDPQTKFNALCHHDPLNITAASMILKLKSREAWICIGNPCENPYQQINIPF